MSRITLIVVGCVSALLFLIGISIDVVWLVAVTKPLPVLVMLVSVVRDHRALPARFVALGLALCALGDIVIGEPLALFVPGLICFLLGHLAYIVAFTAETRRAMALRAVPSLIYGVAAFATLEPGLGDMAFPVVLYIVVICGMLWRAWAWAAVYPSFASRLALLGAALFVASDTVLAFDRFRAPLPASSYIIIVLYWAGQLGITLSMLQRLRPSSSSSVASTPASKR